MSELQKITKEDVALKLLQDRVLWFQNNLGHKEECNPIDECFACRARQLAKQTLDEVNKIWTQ